jgi:enoyl-CoA hydratase/carnithine racemase
MPSDLIVEKQGRVTIATLNRPHRRNALTVSMAGELQQVVADFGADPEQRVMIITGAGEQAFCSGADLLEVRDRMTSGEALPMTPEQDISDIAKCEKPVIAAINGLAIGGGLEIALCCDFRLAVEESWFGLPEVERGFIAGIAAVCLPRMMPIGDVMELMLVGDRLPAADALRLGLIQRIFPREELMAEAMKRAEKMCRLSPAALWGTKQVIRYWRNVMMDEQHAYYQQVVQKVFESRELEEGLDAFNTKRQADFKTAATGAS